MGDFGLPAPLHGLNVGRDVAGSRAGLQQAAGRPHRSASLDGTCALEPGLTQRDVATQTRVSLSSGFEAVRIRGRKAPHAQ